VTILTQPPMTAVPPRVNWRLAGHVPPLASPAPRVRFVEMANSLGPSLVMTALRLTILDVWLTVQAPSLVGAALTIMAAIRLVHLFVKKRDQCAFKMPSLLRIRQIQQLIQEQSFLQFHQL